MSPARERAGLMNERSLSSALVRGAMRQPAQPEPESEQKATSRSEHAEVGTGERQAATLVGRGRSRPATVIPTALLEACDDVGAAVTLAAGICERGRRGKREQRGYSQHREKLLETR